MKKKRKQHYSIQDDLEIFGEAILQINEELQKLPDSSSRRKLRKQSRKLFEVWCSLDTLRGAYED